MKTLMIRCDNPKCNTVGQPEWVSDSGRSHRPPYGWLAMKGGLFGCGPNVSVEVCSVDCLEPAVTAAIRTFYDEGNG